MSRPRLVIIGVVLAGALAGCASGAPGDGTAAGSSPTSGGAMAPSTEPPPGPSPTGRPPISVPASPGRAGAGEITVTGQVEFLEIEGGCLVLRVGPQVYQLMGVDRQAAQPGTQLTVRGRVRTDIATICQVGPVLEVVEVRPA